MASKAVRWGMTMAAALLAAAIAPAQAQDTPTYKCVARGGRVIYSQIPCAGARQLGGEKKRVNVKYEAPSQERATIARRAQLSVAQRQECTALDVRLKEQERELKAKGPAATLQDEMPLVHNKKRFRELHC
jgi:hypothetical protein